MRPGTAPQSEFARYTGLGMQFTLTVGIFGLAGWWLDGKVGTAPWLMVVFLFLGFAGGMISLISKVSKLGSSGKKKPDGAERGRNAKP